MAMEAEGTTGILFASDNRLWFAGGSGDPATIFELPAGHRWVSPVVPSPDGSAVAFLTRAEAGTPYLWVVRSDLTSAPYTVPEGLGQPRRVAWAGEGAVVVGDPPYQLDVDSGRWVRLPGGELVLAGPPSPDGHWWVYGAAAEEGGAGPTLYLVDHRQGGARPLDVAPDGDLVAMPGPWLAPDRFLVALGRATMPNKAAWSGKGDGETPAAAAASLQALLAVEAGSGAAHRLFEARPDESLTVVGASPGGRWVVLAPSATPQREPGVGQGNGASTGSTPAGGANAGGPASGGGAVWRLLDTTTGSVRDLRAGLAAAGVAWDGGGEWLAYLVPEGTTGGAVRMAAYHLGEEDQPQTSDGVAGESGSGTPTGPENRETIAPERWPSVDPAPAAIRRLLAVDLAAGVAWVELVPGSSHGAAVAARWDLAAGRLAPLTQRP
ncbi:hypothetical protein [Thermaerobacter litoralis]